MARKILMVTPSDDGIKVQVFGSAKEAGEAPEGSFLVKDKADVEALPRKLLLAAYNATRHTPVRRFPNGTDVPDVAYNALKLIGASKDGVVETKVDAPVAREPRKPKLIDLQPLDEAVPAREGSKVATLIDLLAQKGGVTLQDAEAALSATGKPVNIRGWMSYDLRHQHGYGVTSEYNADGQVVARLVLPKGLKAPLPHKPKVAPKPPATPRKGRKATEAVAAE